MAFDGIVTKHIVNELNDCLINGKINRVFEPNKNEIILGIYSSGKNYALDMCIDSANCNMRLTTTSKPNPLNAPNFCMLLRKHLIGMKIKSISNFDLERIITITLEGFNELNDFVTKKLIVELMGKHSNIILLNENDMIIDSIRHLDTYSGSNRDILPAHLYFYPNNNKISFIKTTFNEFYNIVTSNKNDSIDNIIMSNYIGMSKLFIHSVLASLNLSLDNMSDNQLNLVFDAIKEVINTNSPSCVIYSDTNKNDYILTAGKEFSPLCVNFFLDDFYFKKDTDESFKSYRNNILRLILSELKKYSKRLYNINKKLEDCNNMEKYRLYGELITSNLYKINNDINVSNIELENYYDNNKPICIPLDKTISPSYNAKKYFKKYNKLKNALEIVSTQKHDTLEEINYIESIVYELDRAKNISEVNSIYDEIKENVIFNNLTVQNSKNKKKKNNLKSKSDDSTFNPMQTILDGYTIYIGKNNKQNDYLTLKFSHKNDIWFHTKDIHGSHVILKTNGDEIEQELINKCASIAAFYSKASSSSNVPVDYTFVRYVKKASGAKPGMVIYTNYTTVNVHPSNFDLF